MLFLLSRKKHIVFSKYFCIIQFMNKKLALITDFDGTISKKDFFHLVINDLLDNNTDFLTPWNDYLNGKIKHIDALSGIFSQIHLSQSQLDDFISTIEIDKYFYDTVKVCNNQDIPVYICSAGTNYYIKKRIADILNNFDITLVSNDATYSKENGMKLIAPPEDSPFYNSNTGISKENVVKILKQGGYTTIYAGDGKPDFESAKIADIVFAKDLLLSMCNKSNIKTQKFDNFNDILLFIRRELRNMYEH